MNTNVAVQVTLVIENPSYFAVTCVYVLSVRAF
jgi:hypothetical protein